MNDANAAAIARRRVVMALPFVAGALAILIGLGVWQLHRLEWKTDLLAAIEARGSAAPVPIEDVLAQSDMESAWFRAVSLRGQFDHDAEIILLARTNKGQVGAGVVTPFRLADGRALLVNRGWVPIGYEDPARRAAGQMTGETELNGVLREPPIARLFTPNNRPAEDQWYWIDIAGIAAHIGEDLLPVVVDANGPAPPGGFPIAGLTLIDIPNNHRQYAITWFGLAATLVGVFAAYAWRALRTGQS